VFFKGEEKEEVTSNVILRNAKKNFRILAQLSSVLVKRPQAESCLLKN